MRIAFLTMFGAASTALAALAVVGHAMVPPREHADPTALYETRDRGQQLFVRQGCYQCHGLVGQGSILSGPSLVPLRLDDEAFRHYVRNPKGAMPPYSPRILADTDLAAIEAYVRRLSPGRPYSEIAALAATAPPPVAAAMPPQAAADPGSALYASNCAACHGSAREGGIGPSLVKEGTKRDTMAIAALIMNPPSEMPKLYPSPLSRDDVNVVAAYVGSLPGQYRQ